MRKWIVIVALLIGSVGTLSAADPAAAEHRREPGRHTYTGSIDGAQYRVETPARWNGTLLLYAHGYFPEDFPPQGIAVTNAAEAETWLLDHGYALAASAFRTPTGYHVPTGYEDQLALLDWFEANVGQPRRTIATGQSLGAAIAVRLGEQHPDRFDGVALYCGAPDPQANFNVGLDVTFAVKTLLAPDQDIDLVHPRDPAAGTRALEAAVDAARLTPDGQAKLSLIASLGNVTGWWSGLQPPPASDADRIQQQANWIRFAFVSGSQGPTARADLEPKVGGNPSSTSPDFRAQLRRSDQTRLVKKAYRNAGIDLDADLDRLDAAAGITADPAAVDFMERTAIPQGRIEVPVITLHSIGDGGAPPEQERWYAGQVDRNQLRSMYVERGGHCSFSAADEVVALQRLERRIAGGRWEDLQPQRLDRDVARFPEEFQQVLDLSTFPFPKEVVEPAFVAYKAPEPMRPSH